jgi:hypothetical protein
MRVKFLESTSLEEMESSANLLLLEGWERDSALQILPSGEFLMTFVRYSREQVRCDHGEDVPPQPTTAMECLTIGSRR